MQLDETPRGLALQNLLKQKLGWLYDWEVPTVVETVGPFDPSVFVEFVCSRYGQSPFCDLRRSPERRSDLFKARANSLAFGWRSRSLIYRGGMTKQNLF